MIYVLDVANAQLEENTVKTALLVSPLLALTELTVIGLPGSPDKPSPVLHFLPEDTFSI